MTQFITIEDVDGTSRERVRQSLRFETLSFVWRIRFNLPLNPSTVNNNTCYVTDLQGLMLRTIIRYNSTKHYIEVAPMNPYYHDRSYILHVTTSVASAKGNRLGKKISLRFKV